MIRLNFTLTYATHLEHTYSGQQECELELIFSVKVTLINVFIFIKLSSIMKQLKLNLECVTYCPLNIYYSEASFETVWHLLVCFPGICLTNF